MTMTHTHGGVQLAAETQGGELMRYRREDDDGDYTFGQGDDTWLINSPEAVAQAIKTRFELWYGQCFLDTTEGTPWIQSVLGKQRPEIYNLAIRQRILETKGVSSITAFDTTVNTSTRRVTFTATVETIYGTTTVTSEA
jgi:hypothetical protein